MKKNEHGFVLFFAMLVAALALSVGFAIYDLTARELDLSQTATLSQYAIYAADTGAECVLYWDSKYSGSGSGSAFGTSTGSTWATSGVLCASQDIAQFGTPGSTYLVPANAGNQWTAWNTQASSSGAITTFTLALGSATSSCAVVSVEKYTYNNALYTTVTSEGFNTCQSGGLRVERALQVSY